MPRVSQTPERSGLPSGVRGAGPSRLILPSGRRGPVVRTPFHCAEADAAPINTATAVAMASLFRWICIIIILFGASVAAGLSRPPARPPEGGRYGWKTILV